MSEEHPQHIHTDADERRLTLEALAQAAEPATAARLGQIAGLSKEEVCRQLARLEEGDVVACIPQPKRQPALWELAVSLGTVQQMLRAIPAGEAVHGDDVLAGGEEQPLDEPRQPDAALAPEVAHIDPIHAALLAAAQARICDADAFERQAADLLTRAAEMRLAAQAVPALADALRGLDLGMATFVLDHARNALASADLVQALGKAREGDEAVAQ